MNFIINELEREKVDESKQMLDNIQRLKQINMKNS